MTWDNKSQQSVVDALVTVYMLPGLVQLDLLCFWIHLSIFHWFGGRDDSPLYSIQVLSISIWSFVTVFQLYNFIFAGPEGAIGQQ